MPSRRRATNVQTSVVSDCRHHWIIECSQQTESKGRCQLCGEERTFQNKMSSPHKRPSIIIEDLPLDDEVPLGDIPSGDDISSDSADSGATAL